MKTSININLFGTVYAIDEDAHKLLDQYLTSMKQYFARQEGGEEIADDIEHRVAELFWELKQQGTESISIEQVTEIMHKIGNPEEMSETNAQEASAEPHTQQDAPNDQRLLNDQQSRSESTSNASDEQQSGNRRYYRDGRDKVLGGVLAGACRYFGWEDPLWLRIIFVLLALFSDGIFVVIYLLLWLIAPKAVTAEQRLKMQGKAVNPDTIKSEVLNGSPMQTAPASSDHSGCLKVLLGMALAPFGCLGGLLIVIFLLVLFVLCMNFIGVSAGLLTGGNAALTELLLAQRGSFLLALVCLICGIGLPLWGLWHWFRRDTHPISSLTSIILFCLWLLALILGWQQYHHLKEKFSEVDWKNIELNIDDDWTDDIDVETDNDSLPLIDRSDAVLPFSAIEFNGVGKLVFRQDSAYSLTMQGSEWLTKHTLTASDNGMLKIELDDQARHRSVKEGITIEVSAPYLTDLKVAGVGTFQIDGGLKQEMPFKLDMEGVGKVRSWDAIECPKVTVSQRGVGSTKVNVDTDSLLVSCEGVGQISLSGNTRSYQRNVSDFLSKIEDEDLHIGK